VNKTFIGLIAVTLLIIIGGVFFFSKSSSSEPLDPLPSPTSYEYYWGDGCPHCKNVQDFFDSWEDYDKANIEKYEVWYNKSNQKRMQQRADACKINLQEMGVPLLVTPTGECIGGDTPIIDHFKNLKFDEATPSPISLGNPEVSFYVRGV
jgi:glutaredoxin